jgi:hypothetical protein
MAETGCSEFQASTFLQKKGDNSAFRCFGWYYVTRYYVISTTSHFDQSEGSCSHRLPSQLHATRYLDLFGSVFRNSDNCCSIDV